MSFEVPKLKTVSRPADYDGKQPNISSPSKEATNAPSNPFGAKLRNAPKPADYDGKEPTIAPKLIEGPKTEFSTAKLKKVDK
ncbi:hypothetical protein O9G_005127 [Rozella allomycis CSF55]|uniref:Uncharacterized protein n=1 Tax=Rozella allomycis (strain CSF55) TaxID=988480 RepID=A0A075AVL5_ROZAC|nr:hypothetical protein O9G_005127 [Rozella allomycis CSF55]|eukprot:EPZ34170.1 hypothetical protein O9G_005127 [Rozella allomycis CSF55]